MEMSVYLHPRNEGERHLVVLALYAGETPMKENDGKLFASFALEAFCRPERSGFDEHFTAQEVPLQARDNVGRAKGWIATCLAQHKACQDFRNSTVGSLQRPTRILEITSERTIQLRDNMVNVDYDYLALSHMWGEHQKNQICLVEERLLEFQRRVPWSELSPTFCEAIRITLALGYRYIWIDSLCIIQDSASDWDFEAQRMSQVYGNAIANIAYLFPPGESEQCRDDPRMWNPCILRQATPSQPGVYIRHLHESWHQSFLREKEDWLAQTHWPLFSRAWTFQEYLLSPRTLLYGHKNLMYQCSHVFYDELLGPIAEARNKTSERIYTGRDLCKNRYFPSTFSHFTEGQSLSSLPLLSFMVDWMNIANEYRTRKLTFAKDRTVAFAGIATAYHQLGGLTYLAGLWWQWLPFSLLWFVEKKPAALIRGERPEQFPRGVQPIYAMEIDEQGVMNAPTWSWFNVPIYSFYRTSFLFNDDERSRNLRQPGRSSLDDIYSAKSLFYQFESYPPNQYPDDGCSYFTKLRVTLDMLTWPVSKDLPADLAEQMQRIQASNELDQDLYWEPVFTYHPDVPSKKSSPSPPRHGMFALLVEFQIVRIAGDFNIQRRLAGVVLTQESQSECWKRVGVWKLNIKIKSVKVEVEGVVDVAERWKEYPLTSNWESEELTLV